MKTASQKRKPYLQEVDADARKGSLSVRLPILNLLVDRAVGIPNWSKVLKKLAKVLKFAGSCVITLC
jgi:hypothetical protein